MLSHSFPHVPSYVTMWENKLDNEFSKNNLVLTYKANIVSAAQEKSYNILTCWYHFPTTMQKMYPTASRLCWRCDREPCYICGGIALSIWDFKSKVTLTYCHGHTYLSIPCQCWMAHLQSLEGLVAQQPGTLQTSTYGPFGLSSCCAFVKLFLECICQKWRQGSMLPLSNALYPVFPLPFLTTSMLSYCCPTLTSFAYVFHKTNNNSA